MRKNLKNNELLKTEDAMKSGLKLVAQKCSSSFLMFLLFFAFAFNVSERPAQSQEPNAMSAVEIASALDYVNSRLDELQKSRGSLASCGCRRPRASGDWMAQAQPAEICDLSTRFKEELDRVFEDSFKNSYDSMNFEMRAERFIENYSCNDKDAALNDLSDLYQKAVARVTLERIPTTVFISSKPKIAISRWKDLLGEEEPPLLKNIVSTVLG
jgi:hypothetical protein